MSQHPPDTARICYSVGKAWPDCGEVASRAWDQGMTWSGRYFHKYKPGNDSAVTLPFRLGGALGAALGTLIMCCAGFVVQSLITSVVALTRLTFTGIFWLLEWAWRAWWRVFCICDECGHSSSMPAYVCDKCGAMHRHLFPNRHGIFTHQCECGCKMRSSMLSGRGRHAACCPFDGYPITNYGLTPVLIAFSGGPSSGKTHFLYRSLESLTRTQAGAREWSLVWQDGDEDRFNRLEAQHQEESVPSTPNEMPTAYRLRVSGKDAAVDRLLRVYDPGGESFQDMEALNAHSYYTRVAGAVYVVDPFALKAVQSALGETKASLEAEMHPAEDRAEGWFERLLEAPGMVKSNRAASAVLAIVISKMDARDLLGRLRASYEGLSDHDAGREFLIQHGLGGLVSLAESHFSQVRIFFGGRTPGGAPDPSLDAAAPLLWIIDQAGSAVANRIKG